LFNASSWAVPAAPTQDQAARVAHFDGMGVVASRMETESMARRLVLVALLGAMSGTALAEDHAPDRAVCAGLESQGQEAFSSLAEQLEAEQKLGGGVNMDRLAACGLDYDTLRQRQCNKAYNQQSLEFLLRHCRYEAWSLARAQCERGLDTISPRYAEFCRAFGRE
jgi:hypothetical protein